MSLQPRFGLAALCLSLLGADAAAATPSWLELRWPELAGCPTRTELEATIVRLTEGGTPQPVAAEAEIQADDGGYSLHLHISDTSGEQRRTLHSARCEALADATAVIVAVAAAPLRVSAQLVPAPPPRIEPVVVDLEPLPSAPPTSPARTRVASWRRPGLALQLGAAAGLGPTARFAGGLSGGLSLLWPRARLDLRGSGWFPSPVRLPDRPDIGVDLRLAAGAVRGCARLLRGSLALAACGGLELGALLAEGVGLQQNLRSRGLWAAGLLALGLQWRPLQWFALGLEVEGLVAITRRRYATGDGGPFYTVPPLGLRLGGGAAFHFF